MKVANSASDHGVDFVHDPFKGHDRPISFRELGDPVFDLLLGFLRWLDMGVMVSRFSAFSHPDRESEKVELPFVSIDNLGLCLVQGKPQPLQYLPQHRHCLVRLVSSAKQDDIVCVSDDAGAQPLLQIMPLPDPVQYMQVEIGQQR